jgi:hypothetical protein
MGYRYVGVYGVDGTVKSSISNGTSNVSVVSSGGNVTIGINGTSNVAVFSNTGAYITGLLSATGNILGGNVISNAAISALGNIISNNIISALGNIVGGNIITSGAVSAASMSSSGNITGNNLNAAGLSLSSNVVSNLNVTANIAGGNITTPGIISAVGNIAGNYFIGNGVALTSTLTDRGSDANNWNTITQMGVYTVNRTSWAGTSGTPLDSQVFVGLLEVLNSTSTAISQVFYPGTVDITNAKIQWSRSYWAGVWTPWIKILDGDQTVSGGEF